MSVNYLGSAGNLTGLNGGTFPQSTAGVVGSYAKGIISAQIHTFTPGAEQIGSVQILVNGTISFALPVDFIDPGGSGIVNVSGDQTQWSVGGGSLGAVSLEGKTVSGRVSVSGTGPAAIVSFQLSNPAIPPPSTPLALLAPGVVIGGVGSGGSLGSAGSFGDTLSGPAGGGSPSAGDFGGIPAYNGDFPTNPPSFPPDPLGWDGGSVSDFTPYSLGRAIAAKQKQVREAFLMSQCPRVMLTQQYVSINVSSATFPLAVLMDLQGTPDWLMLDFGLFNFAAAAANSNVGFRIYDNGSGTPGTVQATGTYQSGRPVWSGVCQGEQVVPWRLSKNCLIELVYISGSAPAASTLEFALSGYLDQ